MIFILKRRIAMLGKVCEVFTKEYRNETVYREIAFRMLHSFKLKNTSESVEIKMKRLSDKNFVSKIGRAHV